MSDTSPIEKTIEVDCNPAIAFAFFTERFGDWWPKQTHSIGADSHGTAPEKVLMEPQVGGRIYEVMPDGTEYGWGKICSWEAGSRIVFSWQFHKPDDQATEVEVRFTQVESGRTRIHLIHRNWANDPNGAALRKGYQVGWDPVLASFMALVGQ